MRNLTVALDLYEQMASEGIEIFEETYNSFTEVCIRCDELGVASEFLQEMEDLSIPIRATVLDSFLEQHVNHKSSTYWAKSPFAKRAVSRLNPQADTFSPKEFSGAEAQKKLDFTTVIPDIEPFTPSVAALNPDTEEWQFTPMPQPNVATAEIDDDIWQFKRTPQLNAATAEFIPSF